jgi:hypothetical protein
VELTADIATRKLCRKLRFSNYKPFFQLPGEKMSSQHALQNHGKPLSFHIIVNARPREVTGEQIGYSQVVSLAFPDDSDANQFLYSIHYTAPHLPDGTLAEGQSIKLENGMKFDVTKTNRS